MTDVNVILWSKVGCSYCVDVKEFFAEKNITYKEVDVTVHDDRRDILDIKYGVRYVPVIEIGKDGRYTGVTELGLDALEKELKAQGVL